MRLWMKMPKVRSRMTGSMKIAVSLLRIMDSWAQLREVNDEHRKLHGVSEGSTVTDCGPSQQKREGTAKPEEQ